MNKLNNVCFFCKQKLPKDPIVYYGMAICNKCYANAENPLIETNEDTITNKKLTDKDARQ